VLGAGPRARAGVPRFLHGGSARGRSPVAVRRPKEEHPMSEQQAAGDDSGIPVARDSTVDAVSAVLVMAIGAVVVWEARRLGAGWSSDGPGSGYFPFYIGLILLFGGLGILVQSLRARKSDTSSFVDRVQLRRVLLVLGPTVVYVAAIMLLGLYVASALFIAGFMRVLGKYGLLPSAGLGAGVNAVFFMMFEVWFKVPLYKGLLNPLGFLGY
jgi:hypothetical protein